MLHVAARNGAQTVAEAIIDFFGRRVVDVHDKYGQSPLVVAVANKNFEVADLLESAGAEVPSNCVLAMRIARGVIPEYGSDSDDSDLDEGFATTCSDNASFRTLLAA